MGFFKIKNDECLSLNSRWHQLEDKKDVEQHASSMIDQMLFEYSIAPILCEVERLGGNRLWLEEQVKYYTQSWLSDRELPLPQGGFYERSINTPLVGEKLGLVFRKGKSKIR